MQKHVRLILYILYSQLLFPQVLLSGECTITNPDPVRIIIIAGQSNAINIHANAKELQASLIDTSVRFYYHCGMPPDRSIPFFSTSENKWTKLSVQRQVPFVGSNEYFFGPEITLINSLCKTLKNLAVIKCAYGGSNLAGDWNRKALKGNLLYKTMMEQINNACSLLYKSGESYSFAGLFWIQGESDASIQSYAPAYFENLKEFIYGVRLDLNTPELPFIISRLPSGQPYAYLDLVRNAQERTANVVANTKWIDTDSLALDKDKIHFISSAVQKLGRLMAEAFLNVTTSSSGQNAVLPLCDFLLRQNYPNPFNPTTTISYSIPKESHVELKVSDMLGREVSTLVNQDQDAGEHKIQFDGSSLPGGIYIYTVQTGGFRDSKKLLLLK